MKHPSNSGNIFSLAFRHDIFLFFFVGFELTNRIEFNCIVFFFSGLELKSGEGERGGAGVQQPVTVVAEPVSSQ